MHHLFGVARIKPSNSTVEKVQDTYYGIIARGKTPSTRAI